MEKVLSTHSGYHESVLRYEVTEGLIGKEDQVRDAWFVDATLGDGGHAIEILKRGGKVVGIDVDPQALERVRERFENLKINRESYVLIQGNFRDLDNLIDLQTEIAEKDIKGIIFDLGVSSLQLEAPERGFSFAREGVSDMRLDPTLNVRALDLVNVLSKGELNELFTKFGEEKLARQLAAALVSARQLKPLEKTLELARIAEKVYRKYRINSTIHPATRMFQALRIAVNDELEALREGLEKSKNLIKNNGHILVISFHSLEDRIVKNTFRDWQDMGTGLVVNSKPIKPSEKEVWQNPRARSAKLRIFEIKNDYH